MDNKNKLAYTCEDDRCYGATGMAISVMVMDSADMLSAISLDTAADEMIELVDDFYFTGNPGLSAKSAWTQILRSFNLSTAMTIGNVMCRSMVRNVKLVDDATRKLLLDIVTEEGQNSCSLDDDECARLFDKNYRYLYQVFNHRGVHDVAHSFADRLKRSRRLTRAEIIEQLRGLTIL